MTGAKAKTRGAMAPPGPSVATPLELFLPDILVVKLTYCIFCYVTGVYNRCLSIVNSYYYFCYPIFIENVTDVNVTDKCQRFGGEPVWFLDNSEFEWLQGILQAYAVECVHMGK